MAKQLIKKHPELFLDGNPQPKEKPIVEDEDAFSDIFHTSCYIIKPIDDTISITEFSGIGDDEDETAFLDDFSLTLEEPEIRDFATKLRIIARSKDKFPLLIKHEMERLSLESNKFHSYQEYTTYAKQVALASSKPKNFLVFFISLL